MAELTLKLFGEITNSSVSPLIEELIDHKLGDPVTVFINSEGGDLYAGLALAEVLLQHNVTTIGLGMIASAASLVFIAGTTRYIGKSSRMLIHQSRWCYGEDMSVLEAEECILAHKDTNNQVKEFYVLRTNLTPAKVDKLFYTDSYLNADQCIKSGFATAYWEGHGISKTASVGFRGATGDDPDDSGNNEVEEEETKTSE